MRRAIWLVAAGAVATALTWFLAGLPGTVVLRAANYTISAATPVALLGALVLLLLFYGLARLLGALVSLPTRWRNWRAGRNRTVGDQAVTRALVALAAGDGSRARREARRALRALGATPQSLLLAAEAERLAGNDDAAAALFRQLAGHKEGAFLGLRGLFRQAMARRAWDEAAILLAQAEGRQPGHDWLRDSRLALAVHQENWAQAAALAAPGQAKTALTIAASGAASGGEVALQLAKQAWTEDKSLAPAALAYAHALRGAGRERAALDVVRDSWKIAPHPDLAEFVIAPASDAAARLRLFTDFVQARQTHPEAQFALAQLSFAAGAMGDAGYHLDAAEASGLHDRRIGLLRADLARARHDEAAENAALWDAANAPLQPGWQCTGCGARAPVWQAACPSCQTIGSLSWGENPEIAALRLSVAKAS